MQPTHPIAFQNAAEALMTALQTVFNNVSVRHPLLKDVRVAVKKYPHSDFDRQVIIMPTGSMDIENGLAREQAYNINVWASTYEHAEDLSQLTELCLKSIVGLSGIKWVEINMSHVPVVEDGLQEEHRLITCTALLSGMAFSL